MGSLLQARQPDSDQSERGVFLLRGNSGRLGQRPLMPDSLPAGGTVCGGAWQGCHEAADIRSRFSG
jgi:hypothetical protein